MLDGECSQVERQSIFLSVSGAEEEKRKRKCLGALLKKAYPLSFCLVVVKNLDWNTDSGDGSGSMIMMVDRHDDDHRQEKERQKYV